MDYQTLTTVLSSTDLDLREFIVAFYNFNDMKWCSFSMIEIPKCYNCNIDDLYVSFGEKEIYIIPEK